MSDLWKDILEAEITTDMSERGKLLDSAICNLVSKGDLASADVQHAIGYAWYCHPREDATRDKQIVTHLRNALHIDSGHKYAKLYLAHHHFDRAEFAQALGLFCEFGATDFEKIGQGWRDAKTAELILCCKLYLGDIDGVEVSVRDFCESLTRREDGSNPDPAELTASLIALLKRGVEPPCEAIPPVLKYGGSTAGKTRR